MRGSNFTCAGRELWVFSLAPCYAYVRDSVVTQLVFAFKTDERARSNTVSNRPQHRQSPTPPPHIIKMQKFLLVALALAAVVAAAPQQQQPEHPVYILKQDSDVNPEGYNFDFETSDGTSRQEKGTLKQISEDHKAIEVTGSYKYVGTDGLVYTVTFIADEHGFQPQEHVEHPGADQQQYQQ
ncbi:cuticular protein RR-1 motif 49 isoform X1 [Bombyx mori]